MALVSRTRSRADEIVTLDNVNKFIDVSINNLAMFSKKAILEASVYLLGDEEIDEEEFLAIYEIATKRRQHPYKQYERIDVVYDAISPEEFETEFRFGITEFPLLLRALKIPGTFTCANGTVCSGMEGLLVLLKRFSYPCRLSDMIPRFGRSVPELSLILNEVISFIYTNHGYLLRDLDQPWLSSDHLENFALAVHGKGAALENCWGFVDGTVRPICRPGENQRVMYNGHKRVHALKFQSVVAPNGLIANLYGPVGKLIRLFASLYYAYPYLSPQI